LRKLALEKEQSKDQADERNYKARFGKADVNGSDANREVEKDNGFFDRRKNAKKSAAEEFETKYACPVCHCLCV